MHHQKEIVQKAPRIYSIYLSCWPICYLTRNQSIAPVVQFIARMVCSRFISLIIQHIASLVESRLIEFVWQFVV